MSIVLYCTQVNVSSSMLDYSTGNSTGGKSVTKVVVVVIEVVVGAGVFDYQL